MAKPRDTEEQMPTAEVASVPGATQATVPAADLSSQLQPPEVWASLEVSEDENDSSFGGDIASSTESVRSSILQYRELNGRTYHRERTEGTYWGPNDDRQNNTLDVGHHALTMIMGDKLYHAPLPDHMDKVLDIGTGTGIWAIDFADEHPEANVIGTDLSPIQPEWVPPNLSFQIDDFTDSWTFEDSSVDFVHLRWLCGSVKNWTELFKQAYRVLKPGGYIETFDFDGHITSDDGTVTEKTAISQWSQIFEGGARKLGMNVSFNPIKEGLQHKALVEAGFVNITEKAYKLPISEWSDDPLLHEVGRYMYVTLANDTEGFVGMMATSLGWTPEQISVYAAHVRREMRGLKVHAYIYGGLAYAQKPLDA
ncbi:hypothetical protein CMQ_7376 [Grosmannia clavigera kw1407]|uniref:Methyltransferase type 11 n=1 Tax=Grosmannia clavigera (strain kw1407 / UAMH 11150) TaxID=655863 RepID=F0XNM3_GROCL|nr:uncharacterized protein CMQ_7376 [Grosmannia clavigera kw1407]EFX00374.1 hypothetical protein CMQ_7376 [Grosmannia clavigera kw1407]